jgi:transcriptional regulator with XRE-family HTH domain
MMTTKQTTQSPTAQFFERALSFSTSTQREIAKQAGFPMPNAISMMKNGQMKVPIERIPALAKAMGVDPSDFLATALKEYQPDVWDVINNTFGTYIGSAELDLVILYRLANTKGHIELNEEVGDLLLSLFTMLAKKG